jgi:hypothetical protein
MTTAASRPFHHNALRQVEFYRDTSKFMLINTVQCSAFRATSGYMMLEEFLRSVLWPFGIAGPALCGRAERRNARPPAFKASQVSKKVFLIDEMNGRVRNQ